MRGVGAEGAGEQRLLLVAAGQRQDVVVDVGRADVDLLPPGSAQARPRAGARSAGRRAALASERMPMFSAIDHSGKMPSAWRSPATRATGAVDLDAGLRRDGAVEDGEQQIGLAVAGEAGKADDLALVRDELGAVRSAARGGRGRGPARPRARRVGSLGARARVRSRRRPWRRPAGRGRRRWRSSAATTLPSRMTTMRSEVSRTSPRRCEIRMQLTPPRDDAAHEGQQLAGGVGVERGGRLVEDDEVAAAASVTVKARATSTIWRLPIGRSLDDVAGADAVAGKDLVELGEDQIAGAAAPAQALERAGWMMRAFSATVRLGQSDSSWKTQRMPRRLARRARNSAVFALRRRW